MKQCCSGGELAEFWTLSSAEKRFSDQRTQQGRLGLAVLLKFFQLEGRFPHYHKEVPLSAVDYVAEQLEVPASAWFDYPLKGRSGSRDREQLRTFLGFRQAANDDIEPAQRWLSQEVVPQDQDPRQLRQPMDADQFIGDLQRAMEQALSQFDANLPGNPKVRLRAYGKNRLVVTPYEPQAEPVQLQRLKAEIGRRWPMTSLLDVLKEADLRVCS